MNAECTDAKNWTGQGLDAPKTIKLSKD